MDTDIEEIKEELKIQRKLLEDTNSMVHKMHRAAVWGRVVSWVWWGTVIILTSSVYYYFLMPYLSQLLGIYGNFQSGASQAPTYGDQLQDLLKQLGY